MTLEQVTFEGHEGVRVGDASSRAIVTTSVGQRVLGLFGAGGNVFAVVPDARLERPGEAAFRLLGGHRLWAAPEIPAITYQPDERPCEAREVDGGVRVQAPADGAGFVKAIELRRFGGGWVVDHTLTNRSGRPVEIAPWAVTQLRPGGVVDLPLPPRGPGPVADRALVLWPYTYLTDDRIELLGDRVRIHARQVSGPLKLEAAPSEGRVAYVLGDEVFEKRVGVDAAATYPDLGAAVQVYVGADVCELETLGPLEVVPPGGTLTHRETWTLGPLPSDPPASA